MDCVPLTARSGISKIPMGYKLAAKRAAALGCEGKWAIHPSQISLANEVFTPPAAEIEKAQRILAALKEAAAQGKGAAALDGRLIDAASARMANNVVKNGRGNRRERLMHVYGPLLAAFSFYLIRSGSVRY